MYPWSTALSLSTVTFLFTVIWGRPLVNLLKRWGIGKQIRVDGPSSHQVKMGTPTMGGWLFISSVVIITVTMNLINLIQRNTEGRSILVPLGALLGFGLLGAVDDWEGIKGRRIAQGLTARAKFAAQVVLALGLALVLYFGLDVHSIALPTVSERIDLGLVYIPIAVFVIVASTNAVNLTDGLDGLASSITIVAFAAYGVIAYLQGPWTYLVQFCFIMVGALMAFMWYNIYPAELFMGDSGALALGATLGVIALMTGQYLLLPLIAIVPVAVSLSSIIQVGYFKLTKRILGEGRRVFKMAPLHHHFEMVGWGETHITQRFWMVNLLSAMLGIALALL
ncbi:MAG: phospho-N-acetylmuramoyl-pentapeptide-transferase [Anaerolineae bacterium]|nr:phospho-N-acetylmuramoyl-pentapeptide-transferase [Anaerolineae bacterium]